MEQVPEARARERAEALGEAAAGAKGGADKGEEVALRPARADIAFAPTVGKE